MEVISVAKKFMDEDFLLNSDPARKLYHEYAEGMPICDYHSHVKVAEIRANKKFSSITEAWLGANGYGDHYKWRLMRTMGKDESLISGNASDWDKFQAWAEVIPYAVGNPVYQWTHLELRRFFGIYDELSPATAKKIYDKCNEFLASDAGSARSLIKNSNVKVVCSTDDPTDTLEDHIALAKEDMGFKVYPAWRPDKALAADNAVNWNKWVAKLEKAADTSAGSFEEFLGALQKRHDFFAKTGCRLSDYGIEKPYAVEWTAGSVEAAFQKARGGTSLCGSELDEFRSALLFHMLAMDAEADWAQQLHFGAARNTNSKKFAAMGADTGYDCIGDFKIGPELQKLLDRLESCGKLTRTIIYTLNPKDNWLIASTLGNFMDGRTPGKMQFGTAWWFNDHKVGMLDQMEALANDGLISQFLGMLTDSRSFLSYPRHEYFRRLLCDFIGGQAELGEIPENYNLLGGIIKNICYNNVMKFMKF